MDVTKGLKGRRVCGSLLLIPGTLVGIAAIYSITYGIIDIIGFLIAAFIILTAILGIGSTSKGVIIAFMVTGVVCSLYFGYATVLNALNIFQYNSIYVFSDGSLAILVIVSVAVFALALVTSVLGVIFAGVPFCANGQTQDGMAQQYSHANAPAVVATAPPAYNYSNRAYVDTTQTHQFNYGNTYVGGLGPPGYNNTTTAYTETKQ